MRTAVVVGAVMLALVAGVAAAADTKCTKDSQCRETGDEGAYCRDTGFCHCDPLYYRISPDKPGCELMLCRKDTDCTSDGDAGGYCNTVQSGGNGACHCGAGYVNQPTLAHCRKADDVAFEYVRESFLEGLAEAEDDAEGARERACRNDHECREHGDKMAYCRVGDSTHERQCHCSAKDGFFVNKHGNTCVKHSGDEMSTAGCKSDKECQSNGDSSAYCRTGSPDAPAQCHCTAPDFGVNSAGTACDHVSGKHGDCKADSDCDGLGSYCRSNGFCHCVAGFELNPVNGLCTKDPIHTGTCTSDAMCQSSGDKGAYCYVSTGQCHCTAPTFTADPATGLCHKASDAPTAATLLTLPLATDVEDDAEGARERACRNDHECREHGDKMAYCRVGDSTHERQCHCSAEDGFFVNKHGNTCVKRRGSCDTDSDCSLNGDHSASCHAFDKVCLCSSGWESDGGGVCMPGVGFNL